MVQVGGRYESVAPQGKQVVPAHESQDAFVVHPVSHTLQCAGHGIVTVGGPGKGKLVYLIRSSRSGSVRPRRPRLSLERPMTGLAL